MPLLIASLAPVLIILFIPYMVMLYFIGFRKMRITSDTSIFRDNLKL